MEEAHRYIQSDHDRFLFGYNIFERIAKEGRKYGVILGLISQRPVEISDTVISQCTNFLIFKINHPMDVDYIRKMVPHITDEIIEKQKSLQSGTCLGFGLGFKIPLVIKMEMPNPAPLSGNCDVVTIWKGSSSGISNNTVNDMDMSQNTMNVSQNLVVNTNYGASPVMASQSENPSLSIVTDNIATPSPTATTSTAASSENSQLNNNNSTNNSNELEVNPSLSIVTGISSNNSPAESISSNSDDVDEKFDDSFIVMNSATTSSGDNGQPTSPMAGPTAIAPVNNSPSSGLAEISEVKYIIHNEKPFTMNPGNQVHCEGFFYIKGEYENLWFETK